MRQFTQFKSQHPGCVLFFRMGDFYELFGEDAERVGPALGLAITDRGNGIAVAGVPHHQRDRYLQRAIDAGFRVAVVDQIEDPKFNVQEIAQEVLDAGAEFLACGTCLKLRQSNGSELCPLSTLKDHYEIIRDSDRVITV